MLLATTLLIAIVVVLAKYNHQRQPAWKYVTLNSLISWLSTVSKGCILFCISEGLGQQKWVWLSQKKRPLSNLRVFDSASRGIYGSAELIWHLRARHFAVLGSLALILALAFDPFTQNLIQYYSHLDIDSSQTAMLSNCSFYDSLGLPSHSVNFVEPEMKANVYNALFNSDSSQPWSTPQFTCSSGNCTWDPVATLAMSATCGNITDKLISFCAANTNDTAFQGAEGATNCTYYLPAKSKTSVNGNLTVSFLNNSIMGIPVALGLSKALLPSNGYISPVQIIAPDSLLTNGLYSSRLSTTDKWQAFECTLEPIVRSFRATVTRGTYHEETLGIWRNGSFAQTTRAGHYYTLQPPWGPEMGMEHNTTFWIDAMPTAAIDNFISSLFAGHAKIDASGYVFKPSPTSQYATMDVLEAIARSNITGCAVKSAEKLRCAVENIASAMSKSFRDTAASTQVGANTTGKAMASQTHVRIYWQWMALPVVIWGLGVVTLVGTIWKSCRAGLPVWKNDVLPLLSIYENDRDEDGKGDEIAYGQKVRLGEINGRIRLSE
ncbi:unnamed protein product [Penicillium manginii]